MSPFPLTLASMTLELTVVTIVVGVLLLASLIALAPLKKIRLPYTVAVMLAGFGVAALVGELERNALTDMSRELLRHGDVASLRAEPPADLEPGDWRGYLTADEREQVRTLLAPLPDTATAEQVSAALLGGGEGLAVRLREAVGKSHAQASGEEHHLSLLDQFLHFVGVGGRLSPSMIFFVFLPPLVFESAFNLDARQLIKNMPAVSVLAVPVLVLSTGITGAVVMFAGGAEHGLTWEVALLFGALISATDPVAVVALFKDLGAPKRLGVLVEGESLFNDGTAIVLFNILLAMAIASYGPGGGADMGAEVVSGIGSFLKVALGGIAVGLLLSWLVLGLIGKVTSKEHVEISLSLVLAYASFVVAEHFLHVSGVMATVTAGLMAGSYGRTKVSPSVMHFMHSFWEYMGFVMNSLIFFFVGLVIYRQISLEDVTGMLGILGATLLGVICARAIGVFGSVPIVQRFVERIDGGYRAVMFWGGLRGAVSLALALIVFTHPDLPADVRKAVLVLASGVVLFTLLVNALTMQPLIVALGLNKPTPVDRFALAYAERERVETGAKVLERLEREGAVLPAVLEEARARLDERREQVKAAYAAVKQEIEADAEANETVAARLALAVEKGDVLHRFDSGELTESATKALLGAADSLLDVLKAGGSLPEARAIPIGYGRLESRVLGSLEPIPVLGKLARGLRAQRLAEDLEATRGLYLAARTVQRTLARIEEDGAIDKLALAAVQQRYASWKYKAEARLHSLNEEFPEYARGSQRIMAELQTLRAEAHALHHLAESGLMTDKALGDAKAELNARESDLLSQRAQGIELDPVTLLRAVPAFADLDETYVQAVAGKLVSRTFLDGEEVVVEGSKGASMFLVARGAVGVFTKDESGAEVPLSSMGCGEFFGEIACLLGGHRTATVRALTPVNLLELHQEELGSVFAENPEVGEAVRGSIYPRAIGRALVDCPQLAPLSQEQRTELSLQFTEETHEPGAVIGKAGDKQRLVYVADGAVRLGEETLSDGKAFGAGALVGAELKAEVVADSATRLLVLPAEVAEAFAAANPATVDATRKLGGDAP